ncbi:MAG: hypothetical protein ABIP71_06695 [Verrucomicrobiota bacterium]
MKPPDNDSEKAPGETDTDYYCRTLKMRVLLQDEKTLKFLHFFDQWLDASAGAMAFQQTAEAKRYAERKNLAGVQVVLQFPEGSLDILA